MCHKEDVESDSSTQVFASTTTAGTGDSGCSDLLAAVARHAELTAVRVRRGYAVEQSFYLGFLLKSKALTFVLTRVIKTHCIVTSRHTQLCSPEG